jgi:hypothetical protein
LWSAISVLINTWGLQKPYVLYNYGHVVFNLHSQLQLLYCVVKTSVLQVSPAGTIDFLSTYLIYYY